MLESLYRDAAQAALVRSGLTVTAEEIMPGGGRADLVVWDRPSGHLDRQPLALIEVKTDEPMAGIGQLLAYQSAWAVRPRLMLAVPYSFASCPKRTRLLRLGCKAAGVELWAIGGDSATVSEVVSETLEGAA